MVLAAFDLKMYGITSEHVLFLPKSLNHVYSLLDVEQAWTSVFYLKSFDMDSVQVGKAVFGKEIYTTLGIEPRTYS